MALTNESVKKLFKGDLQRLLFPKNDFISESKNDEAIFGANSIEVPQESIDAGTGKNPSSYPLVVENGSNTKRSYGSDLYYMNPFHIPNHEADVLNYDKRASIISSGAKKLNADFADDCAVNWSPTLATNFVRTSGDAIASKLSGQTGDRKALTLDDFIEVDRILTNMDVPEEDRVCLLSGNLYAQLLTAGLEGFIGVDKLSKDLIAQGVVGTIFNFKIYKRSRTARYTNDSTPQILASTASTAATTNESALFWHPDFVRKAKSSITVFSEMNKPLYLGSVANCAFTGGSDKARNDEKGVVALIQAAA